MKSRIQVCCLMGTALLLAFTAGCAKPRPAPVEMFGKRVAVLSFDTATWRFDNRGLLDLLTAELWRHGKFQLVERSQIDKVIREQRRGMDGILDDATAVEMGRMLGAQYVVMGRVISANTTRDTSTSRPRPTKRDPNPSSQTSTTEKAEVLVNIRFIELQTGAITYHCTVRGRDSDTTSGYGYSGDESARYVKAAQNAITIFAYDISGVERPWHLSLSRGCE